MNYDEIHVSGAIAIGSNSLEFDDENNAVDQYVDVISRQTQHDPSRDQNQMKSIVENINFDIKNRQFRSAVDIFLRAESFVMSQIRSMSNRKQSFLWELFGTIVYLTIKHFRRESKI